MLNELSCRPTHTDSIDLVTGPFEDLILMPMVITKIDEQHGCVSALSTDGRWVRPEPVLTMEVTGPSPFYRYRHAFHCRIAPSSAPDRRPEDRNLVAQLPLPNAAAVHTLGELQTWMASHCDADVNSAFQEERSVGLIEAIAERVYLQPSTRQRLFVRLVFRDKANSSYDWIVPDVQFSRHILALTGNSGDPQQACDIALAKLQQGQLFLAVALTQPNNRFPGVFRGCQPLVGGVHSFPDYAACC